jgi:hypothetical protein
MNQLRQIVVCAAAMVAIFAPAICLGQAAGVAIEPRSVQLDDPEMQVKVAALKDAGRLMRLEDVRKAMITPSPSPVTLPSRHSQPLEPREIANKLKSSTLRVGWLYLCMRCDKWHVNSAGGYLINADGVGATCHHILAQGQGTMREGYLFAMDQAGTAYPITQVLALDSELDIAVFRLEGASGMTPVPLNEESAPGDAVYLLSDPAGARGYFSAGMINRFYWERTAGALRGEHDLGTLAGVKQLRLNVSTDWAPGSSGSPIVDRCGNAVGHVSKIQPLLNPVAARPVPPGPVPTTRAGGVPALTPGTNLVFHEATPARGVRMVIEEMNRKLQGPGESARPATQPATLLPGAEK